MSQAPSFCQPAPTRSEQLLTDKNAFRAAARSQAGSKAIRKPARAVEPNDSRPRPALPRPNSRTVLHKLEPEHSSEVPSPPR
jgi:hypothetical protein